MDLHCSDLVSKADKNAIILHCLPAYRAKEITDEVIESKSSRIFDRRKNRMHVHALVLPSSKSLQFTRKTVQMY